MQSQFCYLSSSKCWCWEGKIDSCSGCSSVFSALNAEACGFLAADSSSRQKTLLFLLLITPKFSASWYFNKDITYCDTVYIWDLATPQTAELHGAALEQVDINWTFGLYLSPVTRVFKHYTIEGRLQVIHTFIRIQIGCRWHLMCLENTRNITFLVFLGFFFQEFCAHIKSR